MKILKGLRKVGRPPKWNSADELYEAGLKYFESRVDSSGKYTRPLTVVGLAMAVGLDRKGLLNYQHKSPDFCYAIKKLKSIVEEFNEERTFGKNPTGAIFNLRANFGWQGEEDSETSKAIIDTMATIRKILGG